MKHLFPIILILSILLTACTPAVTTAAPDGPAALSPQTQAPAPSPTLAASGVNREHNREGIFHTEWETNTGA